jgi:hypothetical protein
MHRHTYRVQTTSASRLHDVYTNRPAAAGFINYQKLYHNVFKARYAGISTGGCWQQRQQQDKQQQASLGSMQGHRPIEPAFAAAKSFGVRNVRVNAIQMA